MRDFNNLGNCFSCGGTGIMMGNACWGCDGSGDIDDEPDTCDECGDPMNINDCSSGDYICDDCYFNMEEEE